MARLLEGKVAVITGSGRGIGREEALMMAQQGCKIVVNDLGAHFDGTGQASASPAQEVVSEIKKLGGEAVANGDSVSDFKGAKRIVDCAIDTFGKLNIIVNNAGILRDRMIFNMGEEDWDAVIAVHLKGSFNVSRHACEYWREEHKKGNILNGRIINTSSDAGLLGNVGQTNYGAAKAALPLMAIVMDAEMQSTAWGATRSRPGRGPAWRGEGRRPPRGSWARRSRRASSTSSTRATSRRWSPGWAATTPRTCTARCSASAAAPCGSCRAGTASARSVNALPGIRPSSAAN